jgi:hypothetical protein
VTEPKQPREPQPVEPVTELEQAVAAFDAHESARAAAAKPVVTPFSLRDVDRRVWAAVGALLVLVAVGVGGAPWKASFWVTLGLVALISSPFVVAAVFLWQRERR